MVKTASKQKPNSPFQNSLQRTPPRFKGVRKRKGGKWVSEVRIPNSTARIWLGSYDSPQQAARAYDCAVFCLRGRKANFNFPDSLPYIPSASSLSPTKIQAAAAKFAMEEFQLPLEMDATFSGSESQSCINSNQLLEELLEGAENNQSVCLEDFPEENVEGRNFVLLMEEEGRLILQQTEVVQQL